MRTAAAIALAVVLLIAAGCARHASQAATVQPAPVPSPVLFTGPLPSYSPGS